jgi:hypothetical protein
MHKVDGYQLTQDASARCATITDAWAASATVNTCGRGTARIAESFFYPTMIGSLSNGTQIKMLQLNDDTCLQVTTGSAANGKPVRGGRCADAYSSPVAPNGWIVDSQSDGSAIIRYAGSLTSDGQPRYCLDSAGGDTGENTALVIGACDPASSTQRWHLLGSQLPGTYSVPGASAGTECVRIPDADQSAALGDCTSDAGAQLVSTSTNGDGNQTLETTTPSLQQRCLTVRPDTASPDQQAVTSAVCEVANTAQLWRVSAVPGNGASLMQIQSEVGLLDKTQRGVLLPSCLTHEADGSVRARTCDGSAAQQWRRS